MRVLVTGRGTSGSWQIRGEQLGRAAGAHVQAQALDVAGYDMAVIVKRAPPDLLSRLHRAGTPIVWDVVDPWPQPHGNDWTRDQAMQWLRLALQHIGPSGVIAATETMAADCRELGCRVLCVPHHARPALRRNPIREHVTIVGYEGGKQYIRHWRPIIDDECARRGWRFADAVEQLADVDIVLALRDHSGYPARAWKSNVKLANAQGSGTPVICSPERGYIETDRGGVLYASDRRSLSAAFDKLTSPTIRRNAAAALAASTITLDAAAQTYRQWLAHLRS